MGPTAVRQDLVERLGAAGIRATTDPAKLNPPDVAVLVEAVNLTSPIGPCAWTGSITVWLCAPAASAADALTLLEERLVDVAGICKATAAQHTTKTHGQTTWPAYQLTVPATVT